MNYNRFSFRRRWLETPSLLALLLGFGAALNLYAALSQKEPEVIEWMEQWLPFVVSEGSRLLLLGAALVQILVIRGIWRGKKNAWRLACAVLVLAPLLHLGRAFDWHHAISSGVLLILFVICRKQFQARSDSPSLRGALWFGGLASLLLWISGMMVLHRFSPELSGKQQWTGYAETVAELMFLQSTDTQIALSHRTAIVFSSISTAALIIWGISVLLALRPVLLRRGQSVSDREAVRGLIDLHGHDPMVEFAFLPDKQYFFYGEGELRSVVAYALWRDVAVTLADPIGPSQALEPTVQAFSLFCRRQDWKPVFYEVAAQNLEIYRKLGFATFKVAEDARVNLTTFSLQGGKFQNLRTALNKARKTGLVFRWYQADPVDYGLEAQMKIVSDTWLQAKHGLEMTFDLGSFSISQIRAGGVALALNAEGRVEAFTTWLPYARGQGRCIDLMRSLPATSGVIDFLILETMEYFRSQGVVEISLGNAPLANVEIGLQAEDKAIKYLFENFNHIYGYKSLFEFKKKYHPQWLGRYVAYGGLIDMPLVALALIRIHAPLGLWKMLRS